MASLDGVNVQLKTVEARIKALADTCVPRQRPARLDPEGLPSPDTAPAYLNPTT